MVKFVILRLVIRGQLAYIIYWQLRWIYLSTPKYGTCILRQKVGCTI